MVRIALPSSLSTAGAFSLVGPALVGSAAALAVWAISIPADAMSKNPMINVAIRFVVRIVRIPPRFVAVTMRVWFDTAPRLCALN